MWIGRPFALLFLCGAVGCSSAAPTSPSAVAGATVAVTSPDQAVPTSLPGVAAIGVTGPLATPPDCLHAELQLGVLEWRLTNVPLTAQIDKGYSHADDANCGATSQNLRTQNDHLRVDRDPVMPTTLIVRFDRDTDLCGHTQVDVSIDGQNPLGQVLRYRSSCEPVTPPPCTSCPPPPCADCSPPPAVKWQTDLYCGDVRVNGQFEDYTAANAPRYDALVLFSDGTDDSTEPYQRLRVHKTLCGTVHVLGDVVGNHAAFTVDGPVTLSLVTYRKNGISVTPQTVEDGVVQTFAAGPGYMQVSDVLPNRPAVHLTDKSRLLFRR